MGNTGKLLTGRAGNPMIQDSKPALLQHPRRHQLLLNVPLQNLDQKLPQVRAQRFVPGRPSKTVNWSADICAASVRDSLEISDDANRLSSGHSRTIIAALS